MRYYSKRYCQPIDEWLDYNLDRLDSRLEHVSPGLHAAIFKCSPDDYVFLRRLLSFPIALFLGWFFHYVLTGVFSFPDQYRDIAEFTLITLVVACYLLSVQFRATVLLILPTMVDKLCRLFFYTNMLKMMAHQLLPVIFDNLAVLFDMNFCLLHYQMSRMAVRTRLHLAPVEMLIERVFKKVQTVTMKELAESDKEINTKLDGLWGQTEEQMNQFREQVVKQRCPSAFDSVTDRFCWGIIDNVSWLRWLKYTLWPYYYILPCSFGVARLKNHACSHVEKSLLEAFEQVQRVKVGNPIQTFAKNLSQTHVMATLPDQMAVQQWDTIYSFQSEMHHNMEESAEFGRFLRDLLDVFCLFLVLLGMFKAALYHGRYLVDLSFDNCYVNRYFRRVDERRARKHKPHLLPLRGADLLQLRTTLSTRLTEDEKRESSWAWKMFFLFGVCFLPLLYLNAVLYDFVVLFSEGFKNFTYSEKVVHRMTCYFEGEGQLAKALQKYFGATCNFDKSQEITIPAYLCYRKPVPMGFYGYFSIVSTFLLTLVLFFFSSQVKRLRHIICDYFYYRWGKKRILHLYNQRLHMRLKYVDYRGKHLDKIVQAHRAVGDKYETCYTFGPRDVSKWCCLIRIILRIYDCFYGAKHCFVCNERLRRPFIACDTEDCRLLYCEPCLADFHDRCLNCKRIQSLGEFTYE